MKPLVELIKLAKKEIDVDYNPRINQGTCIVASSILIRVLRELKIAARPLSVRATVFNPVMSKIISERTQPPATVEQMDAIGGWSVGVGFGETQAGCWPGHLVVLSDIGMFDLTIDQASRPHKNMEITEPVIAFGLPNSFIQGKESFGLMNDDQITVTYDAFPDDKSFETTPNWNGEHHEKHKALIIDRILWRWKRKMTRITIK